MHISSSPSYSIQSIINLQNVKKKNLEIRTKYTSKAKNKYSILHLFYLNVFPAFKHIKQFAAMLNGSGKSKAVQSKLRALKLDKIAEEFLAKYDWPKVERIFSKRGAYGRWKVFLAERELLQKWHDYSNQAEIRALKEWLNLEQIVYEDENGNIVTPSAVGDDDCDDSFYRIDP